LFLEFGCVRSLSSAISLVKICDGQNLKFSGHAGWLEIVDHPASKNDRL